MVMNTCDSDLELRTGNSASCLSKDDKSCDYATSVVTNSMVQVGMLAASLKARTNFNEGSESVNEKRYSNSSI